MRQADFQECVRRIPSRIRTAANRKLLQKELKKFTAHYAYLCLIAKANGLSPFDRRVAEALWLGNGLLKKVKRGTCRNS